MATDNVVYQLVHTSSQTGVETDNVYFYQRGTGISAGAQQLAEEWYEQVFPTINAVRSNDLLSTDIKVTNLFDATDTFTLVDNTLGALGSQDILPPHDAINFTLARENSTTRNGSKRMASIPETAQHDGVLDTGTYLDGLMDIADKFIIPILGTLSAEWFFPVIVGRILDGDSYRLPSTLAEATINAIIDCVFNVDVSSQTSRKYGNGA